jgi:hypothetical protein
MKYHATISRFRVANRLPRCRIQHKLRKTWTHNNRLTPGQAANRPCIISPPVRPNSDILMVMCQKSNVGYWTYRYKLCAATISLLILESDSSNLVDRSSEPITLPACAICLRSSSKRRNNRMSEPSYTSVILL